MKTRLFFALAAFALTLAATSGQASAATCTSYCSIVRCIGDYICGPYVNSSGQTVCGCHPR